MRPLNESVVLVTGAAGGIGRACVEAFVHTGARVVATDVQDSEIVGAHWIRADVSDENSVRDLIEQTVAKFGALDVLVNNAAVLTPTAPLQETSTNEFDKILAVNLRGVFFCLKYAYPHLQKSRGSVVNVSSMAGLFGERDHAIYSATKGALNALTQSAAADWGGDGIRVNAICPSSVTTPNVTEMISQADDPDAIHKLRQSINCLGFVASPEHIASVVTFLASPAATFITGALMPVSGGSECGYGIKY